MGIAAGAAAAAAAGSLASAGAQIANSGGGGGSATPYNKGYLETGQSAAKNWLDYYASGAGPGFSSPTRMALGYAPDAYKANDALLTGAFGVAAPFAAGGFVGSNPAYGPLGSMAAGGPTNPYLDQMYDLAAGKVRSSIDGQFAGAGRYGSGGHQQAVGSALGDLATNLYGGAYEAGQNRSLSAAGLLSNLGQSERQQQLGALAVTPSLSGAQTANVAGLLSAGNYNDQLMQRDFNAPYDALQRYMNIVNANTGGTTQTPYFTNPAGGILGGGLLGLQAYNMFANQPQQQNTPIAGMPGAYSNVNPNTFNYYANDGAYLSY
jgi:hypothetical protein